MLEKTVTLPELALIAGTRAILGAGVGLLLADRFSAEKRRAAGWALVAVGALSTIPLAAEVLLRHQPPGEGGNGRRPHSRSSPEQVAPVL